jgi:hypothetical protein
MGLVLRFKLDIRPVYCLVIVKVPLPLAVKVPLKVLPLSVALKDGDQSFPVTGMTKLKLPLAVFPDTVPVTEPVEDT